jgi:hypothetical protein
VEFVDEFAESLFKVDQNVWVVLTHLNDEEKFRLDKSIVNATNREVILFDEAKGAWLYQIPIR